MQRRPRHLPPLTPPVVGRPREPDRAPAARRPQCPMRAMNAVPKRRVLAGPRSARPRNVSGGHLAGNQPFMAGHSDPEWVTHAEAAAIVGCGLSTIDRHQRAGDIERRHVADRKLPSLNRASVEAFAERWQREQTAARERAAARRGPKGGPPDDGDVWLDSTTASLVVGVSTQYLGRLALQGRLPAALDQGMRKWWFRRSHIEDYAAERTAVRTRRSAATGQTASRLDPRRSQPPAARVDRSPASGTSD